MAKLTTALIAGIALQTVALHASDAIPARLIPLPADFALHYTCAAIDAQLGWQSIDTRHLSKPAVYALGTAHFPPSTLNSVHVDYKWSVDGARYDRVGPDGHTGADAAALKPFERYKFFADLPFGALLSRSANLKLAHIREQRAAAGYPTHSNQVDFRINDTGLGDNVGGMVVCITDLKYFNAQ
ncbi:hypothetical protein [Roseovarius pelagicus]|uniref:DUF3455 domain-containing protein n=1 Tax=Roseovarius pelagicus TaxID=2980108 RepID=A0ABY6DG09_9RHOB|nr:hypothetical protein [Roseovarius pelagicus]UXX82730.1 hypothetical protein N7U68_16825 [Roseovarius pelagicus]